MEEYEKRILEAFADSLIQFGESVKKILSEAEKESNRDKQQQVVNLSQNAAAPYHNANINDYPAFMKARDVAEILGMDRREIYSKLVSWNIPFTRLSERRIRIPRDHFFKWLEEQTLNKCQ